MEHRLLQLMAALLLTGCPMMAMAQSAIPDRQGDYYSNEAPIKGKAPASLMRGSLWRVVSTRLNCRSGAGTAFSIMRQFKQGAVLQVEVYRGGSDEVLRNATDRSGKPWMPVRGKTLDDRCFLRANQRYIQPFQ